MSEIGFYQAGCLGKLPTFADFVRHNATARETLALDEWIQQGLYHAQQLLRTEWDASFDTAPAYSFIYWPENSDRFLVGQMRPSRDKSGRRYPFVVVLLVDRVRYGAGNVHLAPTTFAPFLEKAGQFGHLAMNGLESQAIARHVSGLSVSVECNNVNEEYCRFLRGTTVRDFHTSLFGSCDTTDRSGLFNSLADILLPFRERAVVRLSLGLRFPLSAGFLRSCLEASFWLDASCRTLRRRDMAPILFWTAAGPKSGGAAYLFFRPPSPRVFVNLMRPDMESDTICILKQGDSGRMAPGMRASLFDVEPLNLAVLMDRLAATS